MNKSATDHGKCTSCGEAVAWVYGPSGSYRLYDTGAEHECSQGGYRASQLPARARQEAEPVQDAGTGRVGRLRVAAGGGETG
jgi:hypothetical protein